MGKKLYRLTSWKRFQTRVKNDSFVKYLWDEIWWNEACQLKLLQKVHLKTSLNNTKLSFRQIYVIYFKKVQFVAYSIVQHSLIV